ncbi:interferon-inducible GTPase 1-like [Dreissena polymorpha]|uniref:interferon-inducible GTPase 1-like n=1 Tax=Dreissena polymorpha TaxID=45954 RepID=UPI002264041F|nr:interferon-inducible GTPase 1-like [Dreissena polymorpha]
MVQNGCMALYIGFSSLEGWLGFIENYINGVIAKAFLPVQINLRTYLGYENLELSVELDEEDFKICVNTITDQLTELLNDRHQDAQAANNVTTTTSTLRSPSHEMPSNDDFNATETFSVNSFKSHNIKVTNAIEDDFVFEHLDVIKREGVAELTKVLKTTECENRTKKQINIAIHGDIGSGKYCFINTIRGIRYGDEGYADVRFFKTTTEIRKYFHPKHLNLVFWELPSYGAPQFSRSSYIQDMQFERYDVVIFIYSGRFREDDIWLAKIISEQKTPCYFVRSISELDVHFEFKHASKILTNKEIIEKIRKDEEDMLKENGVSTDNVFLVDKTCKINKYDFNALIRCITLISML